MLFIFAWGLGVFNRDRYFSGTIKALPNQGLDGNSRKNIWTPVNRRSTLLSKAHYFENAFIIILGLFLIATSVF